MSDAHDLIRQALQGDVAGGVDWQRLVAAMREVGEKDGRDGRDGRDGSGGMGAESEAVLREVLDFKGHIELAEGSELPHAMPPEEMLKAHAVQALARADLEKHREAIQRVADDPQSSERLAGIARMSLTP